MQFCCLCGTENQKESENYNSGKSNELIKEILGLLNLKNTISENSAWLCYHCEQKANLTLDFMQLVKEGQLKIKLLCPPMNSILKEKKTSKKQRIELDIEESSISTDDEEIFKLTLCSNEPEENIEVEMNVPHKQPSGDVKAITPKFSLQGIAELRFSPGLTVATIVVLWNESNSLSYGRTFLICAFCEELFRVERDIFAHIQTHSECQEHVAISEINNLHVTYICMQCQKVFDSHFAVKRHHRMCHKERLTYKCTLCLADFKHKNNFDYHMARHKNYKPFKCITCQKGFVAKYELALHNRTHAGEQPYNCEFCQKSFAQRSNLIVHKRLHSDLRPYKCVKCGARFNSSTHLKTHHKMHLRQAQRQITAATSFGSQQLCENNVAKCTHVEPSEVNCETSRSLLKPNIRINPIQQNCADSTTSTTVNLKASPQILKIDILPPIPITLKSTATQKSFASRKYQCQHCLKYFKQKSTLTKHLRTHTGEKPYKCPLCPKAFADPSNFKRHKILHKNATDAIKSAMANISLAELAQQVREQSRQAAVSPTRSIASDPDPDGLELMQRVRSLTPSSASYCDLESIGDEVLDRQRLPALLGELVEDADMHIIVESKNKSRKQLVYYTYDDCDNPD